MEGDCVITNARTAEMAKLTENAFRDVNIAFANELSVICQKIDVDVWELIRLANRHPRVDILQPGPGVGGHCIAVDPWFIVSNSPEEAKLILAARKVNDAKPSWVVELVKSRINEFLQNNPKKTMEEVTIACYGLSFKADTDDLRGSPALQITQQLSILHTGSVVAVEPNLDQKLASIQNIQLMSMREAREVADVHVLLVDHREFKASKIRGPYIIDTRGVW